jgi:hypothetical protein
MSVSTPKLSHAALIANMEATAAKLTGRSVIVRLVEHPGAIGLTRKDPAGRAVIDLDPEIFLDVRKFAQTFMHEAAHVKMHFHLIKPTDLNVLYTTTESEQYTKARQKPSSQAAQLEAEANQQAAQWMATVKRYHNGYTDATGDAFYAVLQILYHRTDDK